MKRGWLSLLAIVTVAAVRGDCAYTGMYQYPWYTTAKTLRDNEWDFEGSLTPYEFSKTDGVGYSDWPFRPEVAARLGLGNHLQVGVSSDFAPGLGVEGQYEFDGGQGSRVTYLRNRRPDSCECYEANCCIFGRPRLAVGARASYYLNSNATATEGVYDFSPRFLISNERPKTIPYAVNLGFDYYGYEGFKASENGNLPSASAISAVVDIGVPLNFRTPVKLGDNLHYNLRLQPAFAFNLPLHSSYSYNASFSESAGLSVEVNAIDYRSGNEDRYRRRH